MNKSRTVVEIQDLTTTSVGVDEKGRMHVLIGEPDEHQVEIIASVHTMAGLAGSLNDEMAAYIGKLEQELRKWINQG